MGHSNVSCIETNKNSSYWARKQLKHTELRDAILSSDILLLPYEGFRDYQGLVFPVNTEELFAQLKETLPDNIRIDVAVSDDDYVELSLRSDLLHIADILVEYVLAPILVAFLADYIKNRLRRRYDQTNVKTSFFIEDVGKTTRKTVRVSYEGPATEFEKTMRGFISGMSSKVDLDTSTNEDDEPMSHNPGSEGP